MDYYTMTTNAGDESIAHAIQTGTKATFKKIAVGDGNGTYYDPAKTQMELRREVWRGDAVVSLDANNAKRVIVTATIPATVGGFTVREAGIFDTAGTLMVISKLPLSEKVAPESGASSDLVIRLYVEVSDANAVVITVDPSAVMATKADVTTAAAQAAADLTAHTGDAVAHVTQADHDKINGAVQSATLGGAAVPKSGTALQFPAYPTSLPANGGNANYANTAGSAPAAGGTADYAHYSSHAVGSGGAALRNNTATVGGSPSGGSDGDGWDICT